MYHSIKYFYFYISFFILFSLNNSVNAACGDSLQSQGDRNDVLVVVNTNSKTSCDVGEYYADKRNLPLGSIVEVSTPVAEDIVWGDYLVMRDKIITHMQQLILNDDPNVIFPACGNNDNIYCDDFMDVIRNNTKVRYVVFTKGLPYRLEVRPEVDEEWPHRFSGHASLDNYLRYALVNNVDDFQDFRAGRVNAIAPWLEFDRRLNEIRQGMLRVVEPSLDFELIVGRIDGITKESAYALVDRALQAESEGIFGTVYLNASHQVSGVAGESEWRGNDWTHQFNVWGEDQTHCNNVQSSDHYLNISGAEAPLDCHVKVTQSIHGEAGSKTPKVDNALISSSQLVGAQHAANGFENLLNYRKNDTCDITLCRLHPNPEECRNNSTDPLKEINTDCVGVANGFMANHFISFSVNDFQVSQEHWGVGGAGYIRTDDGDGDLQSIRFGTSPDSIDNPTCLRDINGVQQNSECFNTFNASTSAPLTVEREVLDLDNLPVFELEFSYKLEKESSGGVFTRLTFFTDDGIFENAIIFQLLEQHLIRLDNTNGEWQRFGPVLFDLSDIRDHMAEKFTELSVEPHFANIELLLHTNSNSRTFEVGFDNISVRRIDSGSGENLLEDPNVQGGFERTTSGDWALQFLSRLNGTALWGGMTHFQTGGFHFHGDHMSITSTFLEGLPLGDAVWLEEDAVGSLLYGDPLYSPVATKLNVSSSVIDNWYNGTLSFSADAINGVDNPTTEATFSTCDLSTIDLCFDNNAWQVISNHSGGRNITLGDWDSSHLPSLSTVHFRWQVRSAAPNTGEIQSINNFLSLDFVDETDSDGDFVPDIEEVLRGTDPRVQDSLNNVVDGNGYYFYAEEPFLYAREVSAGVAIGEPVLIQTLDIEYLHLDQDGDFAPDVEEILRGTDPMVHDHFNTITGGTVGNETGFHFYEEYSQLFVREIIDGRIVRQPLYHFYTEEPNLFAEEIVDGIPSGQPILTYDLDVPLLKVDQDGDFAPDVEEILRGTDPVKVDNQIENFVEGSPGNEDGIHFYQQFSQVLVRDIRSGSLSGPPSLIHDLSNGDFDAPRLYLNSAGDMLLTWLQRLRQCPVDEGCEEQLWTSYFDRNSGWFASSRVDVDADGFNNIAPLLNEDGQAYIYYEKENFDGSTTPVRKERRDDNLWYVLEPQWFPITQLNVNNIHAQAQGDMAVSSNGGGHIAYVEEISDGLQIIVRTLGSDGSFGRAQVVHTSSMRISNLQIKNNDQGDAVITWHQRYDGNVCQADDGCDESIWSLYYDSTSGWSAAQEAALDGDQLLSNYFVEILDSGEVFIAYQHESFDEIVWSMKMRALDGQWQNSQYMSVQNISAIASNNSGLHVLDLSGNLVRIYGYDSQNGWSGSPELQLIFGGVTASTAFLKYDQNGNGVLSFVGTPDELNAQPHVYATTYESSTGVWETLSKVDSLALDSSASLRNTEIAGDNVSIVWEDSASREKYLAQIDENTLLWTSSLLPFSAESCMFRSVRISTINMIAHLNGESTLLEHCNSITSGEIPVMSRFENDTGWSTPSIVEGAPANSVVTSLEAINNFNFHTLLTRSVNQSVDIYYVRYGYPDGLE